MPLSRNVLLVASWNWYERAPGTGFHANDGVRWNVVVCDSSARRRNPRSAVGAETPAADVVDVATSVMRASRIALRRERTVIPRFRHAPMPRRPSEEGCEKRARGQHTRVVTGAPDELNRRRQAV